MHFLAWIALVPLWIQVKDRSPRQTSGHFLLAGMVFHLLTLQWLVTNIYWGGGWAIWGYVLVCLTLALYWAVLGFVWKWIAGRLPGACCVPTFVLLWGAKEFTQSFIFTGFGWTSLAHSQSYNLYVYQWGALGGFTLISMIIVLVNAVLGEAILNQSRRIHYLAAALALAMITGGLGYLMLRPASYSESPLRVGIFQSNTPIQTKWDPEYKEALLEQAAMKSRLLADEEPVDLFIWPEALVLIDIESRTSRSILSSLLKDTDADLFTGAQRIDAGTFYNSSYYVRPDLDFSNYYDKIHLAPFGEYVPFASYFPFLRSFIPSMSDQTPGGERRTFASGDRTLGPLICFEVLFSPMSQRLLKDGADFITVITNLGWFGVSNAIPQELAIAKLRAIETRLPVVQASNTGISGIIDPYGRLTGLDRFIDKDGIVYGLNPDVIPEHTVNMRIAGTLPLPNPAKQPIPFGPLYWPYVVSGLCVILFLYAVVKPKSNHDSPKDA